MKVMKSILISLFLLVQLIATAQYNDTVYIDPDFTGTSDGSFLNPYKFWGEWNDIQACFSDNTAYVQKCGTKDFSSKMRRVDSGQQNIFLGSYGSGEKPIFHIQGNKTAFRINEGATNIILDNLRIEGDTNNVGEGISGNLIRLDNPINVEINNCIIIYSGHMGINGSSCQNLHIDSTIVRRTMIDGIYLGGSKLFNNLEISYCIVDSVNMNWVNVSSQWDSPGDCLQFGGDSLINWHIHHNVFDKSATGFKFAVIWTALGGNSDVDRSGIFEYNTVFSTKNTPEGGGGLFVGTGQNNIIRYNVFSGETSTIANRTRHSNIVQNVFYDIPASNFAIDNTNAYSSKIYNNVFYNCKGAINTKASENINNIFVNIWGGDAIKTNGTNLWTADYNCYYGVPPEGDNTYISDYPQFADTLNGDFHLLSSSPCIDAGTDVGLTEDGNGTLLPQGNGFDMGVYEYVEQMNGGDIIYIDPENSGNLGQNGSLSNPFDSWDDIPWSDTSQINGKSILQKKGTVCETTGTYTVTNATGVTIGAYGDGTPPVLYSTNTGNHIIDFVWSKDCKVENLIVRGDTTASGVALSTSAVRVYGYPYQNASLNNNVLIENCIFENTEFGVRLVDGDDVTINNCEIKNIEEDGIYASDVSNLEISYCNIHDVNLKWYHVGQSQTESPGDGIELVDDCINYNIHHNTIDRSNSGNKFCFSYSALSPNSINGIFDHNECITPLSGGDGGAAIYIGQGNSQEICYNTIEGEQPGVINMSDNLNIYYNIFKHLPTGILSLLSTTPTIAENNVFYDVRTHIQGGNLLVKNNIFNFTETGDMAINLTSPSILDESNNLYSSGAGGNNSVIGDPMFVDPASGDFHLQNGSPCYDAGLDLGLTVDMDSIPVPQGVLPEIGSYELMQTNTAPQIDNQSFSIAENSVNGTSAGTVVATDPDAGQSLTYTILSGNTNNAFSLNSSTGELTVANSAAIDYETNPTFGLTVQVQDNGVGNLTDQATVTVNITDVNENPEIQNQSFSIAENSNNGTQVGTVAATDPDNGQSLTYTILSGNTNNAFSLNPTTGELTVSNSAAIDYETNPTFGLTVQVQDDGQGTLSDQATITVNVTDQNEPPVINNQSFTIEETIGTGESVGIVQATDPDNGQTLTFSINSGNIDNAFAINSLSGELFVADSTVLDFATNPVYFLDIEVQDNGVGNLTDNATVTVSLSDVNQVPVIQDQTFSVAENSGNGTAVGTVVASDPDVGQTLTYSILSGNTGNAFSLNSSTGELSISNSGVLDYETNPVFDLTVQVQDDGAGNLTNQATVTVNLIDVNENPEIQNQSYSIAENSNTGTQVGTVTATDPDNGQTLTYTILSGNTGNAFSLNSTTGVLTVATSEAIDYETNPTFGLTVQVQDDGAGNLTSQATVTVNLTDVNESPEIQNQSYSIAENSSNGTQVGTVTATDPDNGQTLTYTILSGNTGNAFSLNSSTGELTVSNSSALDYESNPIFDLTVQVQDDGSGFLTDEAIVTVNLIDQNESPVINDQSFTIEETIGTGELVGVVQATDPDNGQTLTFSITSGNMDNAFAIDPLTGDLTIADSTVLDFAANPVYYLTVQVQDDGQGNLTDDATVTVSLTDVNQAPEIENQSFSIAENSPDGSLAGTVVATDPDAGQTLTYSIISGNTDNAFAINSTTGDLTVANSTILDYETTPVFILTVQVQDDGVGNLTAQATVTVNLTDVNEVPEIGDYTFEADEFSEVGTEVGIVEATDPDNGQTITYSITSGNTDEAFGIDSLTGVITVINSEALDYEINPQFILTVKAEDNGPGNLFVESNVTINVLQITGENETFSQTEVMLSLFPNPAEENINIGINSIRSDKVTLRIFNVRGEEILQKEFKNYQTEFNTKLRIGDYPKGVYILYIINDKSILQRKFIKL